jgi:hypothetical protein
MIRKLTVAAATLAFSAGTAGGVNVAQAKHGTDDPAPHTLRDDHGGARAHTARHHERRHHHRHGGRRNHTALTTPSQDPGTARVAAPTRPTAFAEPRGRADTDGRAR